MWNWNWNWMWINAVKTIQQKPAGYLAVRRLPSIVWMGLTGWPSATALVSSSRLVNSILDKFSNAVAPWSLTNAFFNKISPVQKSCAMRLNQHMANLSPDKI